MLPLLSEDAGDLFLLLGFLVVAGAIALAFLRHR